jgi:hypothetical protein
MYLKEVQLIPAIFTLACSSRLQKKSLRDLGQVWKVFRLDGEVDKYLAQSSSFCTRIER